MEGEDVEKGVGERGWGEQVGERGWGEQVDGGRRR